MLSHADGDSTLMTSAPMDARCSVAYGPAHIIDRSITRTPSSGSRPRCAAPGSAARGVHSTDDAGVSDACQPNPPNGRDGTLADPIGSSAPRTSSPSRPMRSAGVLTTPMGTLLASPRASSSSLVLSTNHTYIFTVTCSSFSGTSRSSGSAKRSSVSSGSPTSLNSAGIWRSRQNTPAQPSSAGYTPHWPRVWLPRRTKTGAPTAVAGPYSSSIPAAHSCAERSTSSPA